jgi:cell division protein FtsB
MAQSEPRRRSGAGRILIVLLLVILTAALAGGGVYVWQSYVEAEEERVARAAVIDEMRAIAGTLDKSISALDARIARHSEALEQLATRIAELEAREEVLKVPDVPPQERSWVRYEANRSTIYYTEDWVSFGVRNGSIPFEVQYPVEWVLREKVFFTPRDRRVAEFFPGTVDLKKGQSCLDDRKGTDTEGVVEEQEFSTELYKGIKRLERIGEAPEGRTLPWYRVVYCLSDGERAFRMAFFTRGPDEGDLALFDFVMMSVRFE